MPTPTLLFIGGEMMTVGGNAVDTANGTACAPCCGPAETTCSSTLVCGDHHANTDADTVVEDCSAAATVTVSWTDPSVTEVRFTSLGGGSDVVWTVSGESKLLQRIKYRYADPAYPAAGSDASHTIECYPCAKDITSGGSTSYGGPTSWSTLVTATVAFTVQPSAMGYAGGAFRTDSFGVGCSTITVSGDCTSAAGLSCPVAPVGVPVAPGSFTLDFPETVSVSVVY